MPRPITPAQRATQITFALKGDLKNAQIAYIRVAARLAKVRDEKLYRALKHDSTASGALVRAMQLGNPRGMRLAAIRGKSPPGRTRMNRRGPRRAV